MERRKEYLGKVLSKYGVLLAFIIICLIAGFLSPVFFTKTNILNVLRQVSINGLLALGMTFIVLTGGIDLSVGSVVALCSVVVAGLIRGGMNIALAIMIVIFIGVLFGFISGFSVAQWGLPPFAVTLAIMTIARGVTYVYTDGKPISDLPQSFLYIGKENFFGVPIPVIILLISFLISYIILYKMSIGKYIYAVGGNEKAALVVGIRVKFIKIFVYAFSGITCAISGVILTARVSAGLPQSGTSYELDAIAAVVIGGTSLSGGRGSLFGTFIGILILGVVNNALDLLNVSSFYQQIVKGLVIFAAIMLDMNRKK